MDECNVQRECRLSDTKEIGTGLVVFGEIVVAFIWDEILRVEPDKRYPLLDQIMFSEDEIYSALDRDYVKPSPETP